MEYFQSSSPGQANTLFNAFIPADLFGTNLQPQKNT